MDSVRVYFYEENWIIIIIIIIEGGGKGDIYCRILPFKGLKCWKVDEEVL